jgi:Flp pilus assembly protein TadG
MAVWTRYDERGSAVAEFVMVSALVVVLFLGTFQVGLALHVRNVLISCASEGARVGARLGSDPALGVDRTEQLIGTALSGRFAEDVTATVGEVDGVEVVIVRVRAPLPVFGPLGPDDGFDVVAHAFMEDQ